jgi:hypothetical protein
VAVGETQRWVFVFGGESPGLLYGDLHVFDAALGRWAELPARPACPSCPLPSPRAYHSALLDAEGHRLILHGGFDGSRSLSDLWAYDLLSRTADSPHSLPF